MVDNADRAAAGKSLSHKQLPRQIATLDTLSGCDTVHGWKRHPTIEDYNGTIPAGFNQLGGPNGINRGLEELNVVHGGSKKI
jgi:hypothetical protein